MKFDEFYKRLGEGFDVDRAYQLYVQARMAYLEKLIAEEHKLNETQREAMERSFYEEVIEEVKE